MAAFYRIPTCCTGLTLAGFYGSTVDQQKEQIFNAMSNSDIKDYYANIRSFAMVMATTTERQTKAKEALEEIGFSSVGPFTKDKRGQRHKETGALTLHYINANDFQDWIDAEKKRRDGANVKTTQRRFGRAAGPALTARLPSCTIRDMKQQQFIPYYFTSGDIHRFVPDGNTQDRFCNNYGVTPYQFRIAIHNHLTIGSFASQIRQCQRDNNGSN